MSGTPSVAPLEARDEQQKGPGIENRDLRVELEIERGGPCTMDELDGDVVDVNVRFARDTCQCDVGVRQRTDDGDVTSTRHFKSDVCDHCPGVVFADHGCIPRYLRIGTGSFVMETYMSSTEAVAALVSDVRERCKRVSVRAITSTEQTDQPENCTIDMSALTPKQREAVHRAKAAGYYDPDTKVPLEELAGELDISKSALSQRLQRAEANVVRQLPSECSCFGGCK